MSIERTFSCELLKLAKEKYVPVADTRAKILEGIQLIRKLPKDIEKALEKITEATRKAKPGAWSHGMVAVPRKALGDLEAHGFTETSMAVPLPGEQWLSSTWRRGSLHAHQAGPLYLFHWDENKPGSLGHMIRDVVPALKAKYVEKAPEPVLLLRRKTE